jgi:hypothetical protein
MNLYEFGVKLALHDSGLEKLALGRSRQYMHEQVYKQMAPGAPMPQNMQSYVQNLQGRDSKAWNKQLAQQQAGMQQQVAAKGQPMAMSNTQQMRGQLQGAVAQQQAAGQAAASGAVGPRAAGKQMAAAGKQVAQARAPVQAAIANRPPVVPAPLPGGGGAAAGAGGAGAKGGFLRGLGRFAGKHPIMTGLAAAGAVGAGTYAATRPKPVTQDYWG